MTDPTTRIEDQLFDRVLEATAARRACGPLFPLGPDSDASTYFTHCRRTSGQEALFSLSVLDSAGLRAQLASLWSGTELDVLVDEMVACAEQLRAEHRAQHDTGSIPELVYAMY